MVLWRTYVRGAWLAFGRQLEQRIGLIWVTFLALCLSAALILDSTSITESVDPTMYIRATETDARALYPSGPRRTSHVFVNGAWHDWQACTGRRVRLRSCTLKCWGPSPTKFRNEKQQDCIEGFPRDIILKFCVYVRLGVKGNDGYCQSSFYWSVANNITFGGICLELPYQAFVPRNAGCIRIPSTKRQMIPTYDLLKKLASILLMQNGSIPRK